MLFCRLSALCARQRSLLPAALAVCLALLAGTATAAAVPIQAEHWTGAGSPRADAPSADGFVAFDPARLNRFPRNPDGAWLRIQPREGRWPAGPLVLQVHRVVFGAVTLHIPGRDAPLRGDVLAAAATGLSGYGAPVFELPADLPPAAPLLLRLEPYPTLAPGVTITVEPLSDYLQTNALWVALTSASLGAMLAMALTAIVFLLILRDRAYLWYALYLACFVVLQAIVSGYLFTVLRLQAWAPAAGTIGKAATIVSVISAYLFLVDFARMQHTAPRMRWLMLGYVALFASVVGAGLVPAAAPAAVARAAINPLLALGALLLPVAALVAWIKGSRYGAYFLLGWLPLMAVTFMTSMQVAGAFADWPWLDDVMPVAGSFEAVVLAIGLADRALAHRRRFHFTEQLSMTDALTGLLNRRAWEQRFPVLAAEAQRQGRRLYVLFCDLDRFKALNDELGHRAGDDALSAVATTLRRIVPADSLVCRYGGEEFVIALCVDSSAQAHTTAETLRAAVASRGIPVDHAGGTLTLSIGLARHRAGDAMSTTIEQADRAMYRAKGGGRNRVIELEA
ncbi:MAG: diguanylate cyclase [Pseudomonadota bacterium]